MFFICWLFPPPLWSKGWPPWFIPPPPPAFPVFMGWLLTEEAEDTPHTDETVTDTFVCCCCWLFGCHAIVLSLEKNQKNSFWSYSYDGKLNREVCVNFPREIMYHDQRLGEIIQRKENRKIKWNIAWICKRFFRIVAKVEFIILLSRQLR